MTSSRALALALVVSGGLGIACVGSGRAAETDGPLALHAGATSVEFGVNTFGDGGGGTIAARRHFSPGWAARLALDLDVSNFDGTSQDEFDPMDGTPPTLSTSTRNGSDHDWRVSAQAVAFPVRSAAFAFGFAFGPFYEHNGHSEQRVERSGAPAPIIALDDHASGHRTGGAVEANLEWFVHRRISLRARTGTDFGWQNSTDLVEIVRSDPSGTVLSRERIESVTSGFSLHTPSFGLGLVAYF